MLHCGNALTFWAVWLLWLEHFDCGRDDPEWAQMNVDFYEEEWWHIVVGSYVFIGMSWRATTILGWNIIVTY